MTIWYPDLSALAGPKYRRIVDALARDVRVGRVGAGEQLPTHRDLADRLGVTVGTITRAYTEARRRGLVSGEVGRGTFVRQTTVNATATWAVEANPDLIDLAMNTPTPSPDDLIEVLPMLAESAREHGIFGYQPYQGALRHRQAGATWLRRCGVDAVADDVLVTSGAQHAMTLAFSVLAEPGDTVLAESLTYPGMNTLARFLRLRTYGVAMDAHGLRPDALDQACRKLAPKALYCTPTVQNPTASIMPERRRREIAEVARAHSVPVVEDDIYSYLVTDPPPPITSMIPDGGYFITGLSKSIAPALRIAYLRAPASAHTALVASLMATTIMASPITAELATILIETGRATKIAERHRVQARARQELAHRILGDHASAADLPQSLHLWVTLPEPWRAAQFVSQARARGVAVASPELFVVGRSPAPHAVRVSLGAVRDLDTLERGLRVLAQLLASPPDLSVSGV